MLNKEIVELKNEFLKEIREVETKLDKKIEKQSLILDTRNNEHEEKINLNIQKNEELYDIMLKEKVKIEKLSELFVSYKKLNDMLMSHEIRINNLLAQNNKLSQNYNKILTDYLTVPGYIGASCHYKTLSEYIQNNINEMAKIKTLKESEKRVSEDIKGKLDNFMKNMLNLVDNTLTRCNQYTDSKHIFIENMLNSKLVEFREKNMELRTQIFTNFNQTTNEVENFKSQLNELKTLKETITDDIEHKFDEMKKEYEENKHNIKKNMEEIIKYKNSLNELIDKKFEHLSKRAKNINNSYNRNEYNSKPKKNEIVSNIKISRTVNKKEDEVNSIKRINTINSNLHNKVNEELVKNKIIKRNTVLNGEISNKVKVDLKEKKENNKSDLSDEHYSNEENNVTVINNNVLKEEENFIKEAIKIDSSNPQILTEVKNDDDKYKQNDNNNDNNNNVFVNEKNDNDDKKDEEIKISINDNKENIIDTKYYNTIENTTSVKALDSSYVDNTKNKNEQNIKNSDINPIMTKEKNIIIPKLASILAHEKEKINFELLTNRNIPIKNPNLNNDINKLKRVENRNVIIKSNSNTLNHFVQESKEKEKELKTIHSDRSIFERHFFKTSQKFNNIQTQTTKIILNNKKKAKFPNIGFSYKVINLGSDIKFRDLNLEKIQELKENAKINVDLTSPLTNTYRAYQKKKNEKKNNQLMQSNEAILSKRINQSPNRQNVILPAFKTCNSFHRNNNRNYYKSVEKKKRKNTDYEYSLESPKSPKAKLMSEIKFK